MAETKEHRVDMKTGLKNCKKCQKDIASGDTLHVYRLNYKNRNVAYYYCSNDCIANRDEIEFCDSNDPVSDEYEILIN